MKITMTALFPYSFLLMLGMALSVPANALAQSLIAEAGSDLTAGPATAVTLDGRGSYAASDTTPLRYVWKQIRGFRVSLTDAATAQPGFVTPKRLPPVSQRQLVFRLSVMDGLKARASDDMTVTLASSTACAGQTSLTPGVCLTPPRFNDSGITQCSDTHSYGINCPLSLYPGQDGDYGRDARQAGVKGFNFTRLDASGNVITQAEIPATCVRDNVTGLVWENKTAGGLHAVQARYTQQPTGEGSAREWLQKVNADGWCGYRDWRLPSLQELESVVDYGIPFPGPVLDPAAFPLTLNEAYWTDASDGRRVNQAYVVQFDDGQIYSHPRTSLHPVRLVRGTPLASRWFVARDGQEVTDQNAGLIWKRCVEGMTWNGESCTGSPRYFTWYEALQWVVAGEKGWRVPNVKEMSSLIEPALSGPLAIDPQVFPQTPNDLFWTSSPYTLDAFYGWIVQSFYGYTYFTYLEDTGALRLVRSGNSER